MKRKQNLWKDLVEARDRLRRGDVVGIPTETVYGLAARIDNEEAIRRVFAVKQRPFFDPLIVHVSRFEHVEMISGQWPLLALHLASHFWPGPLTLVLPKSEQVNPLITSGLETVAVRMPAHPLARRLIETVGVPLAAPSANKFGKTSPTCADHVRTEFPGDEVFVLDGGPAQVGLESTVVRVEADHVDILRPGAVTREMITKVTRTWQTPIEVRVVAIDQASPGHLQHHYMPDVPVVIVDQSHGPLTAFDKTRIAKDLEIKTVDFVQLRLSDDPAQAARELYQSLRESATQGSAIVVTRKSFHTGGGWTAIWDRLARASRLEIGP